MSSEPNTSDRSTAWQRDLWIAALLPVATVVVYAQLAGHGFVFYDDDDYVARNRHVQAGLTLDGLRWAWTTGFASNWHPLTWLSHMLDCELFGADPGRHHLSSLFLHVASALLLFAALRTMTGSRWRSGFVAAVFALHPLHVESVAWASERKDVLSGFFWMATLLAYASYARQPGIARYLLVALCLALGLLSKPMVVTLPFVLLLLDFWPLARLGAAARAAPQASPGGPTPRATPRTSTARPSARPERQRPAARAARRRAAGARRAA
jgi:protein O-mannosyl-transferase